MARTTIGIAIGIAFVSAVIWSAFSQTGVGSSTAAECEICVDYKQRSACSTARAADPSQAEMQAHSSACSQVTSGVTETLECSRLAASVRRCSP